MSIQYKNAGIWLLRLIAAFILIQTLFFKFSASEESVYIFTETGMEPWGRIGSGIAELVAAILILVPVTTWIGSLMGIGLMSGAIFFHLTKLGIVVKNDGGLLFIYALVVLICCVFLLLINRQRIRQLLKNSGIIKL